MLAWDSMAEREKRWSAVLSGVPAYAQWGNDSIDREVGRRRHAEVKSTPNQPGRRPLRP